MEQQLSGPVITEMAQILDPIAYVRECIDRLRAYFQLAEQTEAVIAQTNISEHNFEITFVNNNYVMVCQVIELRGRQSGLSVWPVPQLEDGPPAMLEITYVKGAREAQAGTRQAALPEPVALSAYAGKVSLVVNVASKCGLTPQYEGLQALHEELSPMGFTVLAFPCNDFGGQEPGSPAEIRTFCTESYEVSFPIFSKLQTKEGEGQSELYSLLGTKTGDLPGWNFGKYLIAADGTPLGFYSSRTSPKDPDLRAAIDAALNS